MTSKSQDNMIRIENGSISIKTGVVVIVFIVQLTVTILGTYYGNRMALNNMDNKYNIITNNLMNQDVLLGRDISDLQEKYDDLKAVISYRNEAVKPEEPKIRRHIR